MTTQDCAAYKDRRVLVLIVVGLGVLLMHWFLSGAGFSQALLHGVNGAKVDHFPTAGGALQNNPTAESLINVDQLSAQTSCSDIPPHLALFLNLPMPINLAESKDLIMLPGIGPHRAKSILEYKVKHGKITGPNDLAQINGFGPAILHRLLPLLCFDQGK